MVKSLKSLDDLPIDVIDHLLADAAQIECMSKDQTSDLIGKILCPLFFQESSRTFVNSTVAFTRLGGSVIPVDPSRTRIGSAWNEPIRDFCELLNTTCDLAVIRLPISDDLKQYSKYLKIPFINAGNGVGNGSEHPIQALTDLYTMRSVNILNDSRILMIGGKHIRTTRTQAKLFRHFGYSIDMISPTNNTPNEDIEEFYRTETQSFDDLRSMDLSVYGVIYHNGIDENAYIKSDDRFNIDTMLLKKQGFSGKVMHSLPRLQELSTDLDDTDYNLYFEQMGHSQSIFKAVYRYLMLEE